MKKRFYLFAAAMLVCCVSAVAQTLHSLTVGASPYGFQRLYLTDGSFEKDNHIQHSYKFKSYWNTNIGYFVDRTETKKSGSLGFLINKVIPINLTEISYTHATFDKYKAQNPSYAFTNVNTGDLNDISLIQYVGSSICDYLHGERVQLFFLLGLGGGYLKVDDMNSLMLQFGAKVRIQCYLSNKMGIYVGANYKSTLAGKAKVKNEATGESVKFRVHEQVPHFDAGFFINL